MGRARAEYEAATPSEPLLARFEAPGLLPASNWVSVTSRPFKVQLKVTAAPERVLPGVGLVRAGCGVPVALN